MMHHVPRTRLTAPAVAGPVERKVRPRCERGDDGIGLRADGSGGRATTGDAGRGEKLQAAAGGMG